MVTPTILAEHPLFSGFPTKDRKKLLISIHNHNNSQEGGDYRHSDVLEPSIVAEKKTTR